MSVLYLQGRLALKGANEIHPQMQPYDVITEKW